MTSLKVLVIEDNRDLAANLVDFLSAKGHAVDAAGDGLTGLHLALVNSYDAIALDLILPGMDGITLCRKLREEAGCRTPVLMLTARDSLEDKIIGLESGADDYLVKPFALREVEVRLRTLARRASDQNRQQRLQVGDLILDVDTVRLTRGHREVKLPPIPLRILELLMRASPRVLGREEIERAVWGDSPPDSDALRAHMHVLRSGIDQPGESPLLHTLRGHGWQLTPA
ncbi:MAG: response regulator transcription factor [Rhodocyclaceae bacterium]|nr:response regulator transcription factor [Rhodocyclaceae bacterium]